MQGRFKHLFRAGNEGMLEEVQAEVDKRWARLLMLAGEEA
jgi:pyruvate ferredoxin oxidoreductase beta subunit